MAGIERPDHLQVPTRHDRPSDHEMGRQDGRKGGDLSGRFGTGGMPSRDGSGRSAKDNLQAREKAFEQALRASGAGGATGSRATGSSAGHAAQDSDGKTAEAGRQSGRPDRGSAEEETDSAVLLARAGPEQSLPAGRPPEGAQALSSDLSQRIDALARKVGDQIDAQLRVNLIGAGDGGFRLRVAIEDPALALKSITVRGDGDMLSISLHFAQDVLDRETLATLAGQLATTLAARFPRRTIEISGLEVVPRIEGDRDAVAAEERPTGLGALFARR